MKVFAKLALAAVFIFAAGASEVYACSCESSPSVAEQFTASPIVVTARLDELEELDRTVAGTNVYKTVAAVMTVDRSYKGIVKAGQKIRVLSGGGGECSMSFVRESVGQRFLFFTTPAKQIGNLKGRLHWISTCSRSARVEAARGDLNFLDNRKALTGKTRLSGTIKRFSPDPPSLANIKVEVTGTNFAKTVETDENGYFELWDLPAGKYRVSLLLPNRTRIRGYKMLATDKTWRQDLQPDNSIPAVITARKHLEMTVGIESIVPGS
jgi:hypothetical protein